MELYSEGKTEEDIANCLKRCPLHPQIFAAIKSAQAHGCDLRIASDSNSFFIESILKHHGLLDCFSEITTNPSFVDEEGRLKILPYHDVTSSPHGCNLCPPNMCKVVNTLTQSVVLSNLIVYTFIWLTIIYIIFIDKKKWHAIFFKLFYDHRH